MTAEPDLLPSSVAAFTEALHGDRGSLDAWLEVNDEREVRAHVEAYARANVAHATAAKDAEIEALEVQIAGLTAQVEHHTAYAITHRGVLRYCTSGMRDAYADEKVRADAAEARAERLAEALRLIAAPKRPDGTWNRDREACRQIAAEAIAVAQENDDA